MRVLIVALLLALSAASFGNGFEESPAWTEGLLRELRSCGVLQTPVGSNEREIKSRYLFAVYAHSCYATLEGASEDLRRHDEAGFLATGLESHQKALPGSVSAVTRLVDEFTPELRRLGADLPVMLKQLSTVERRLRSELTDRYISRRSQDRPTPKWARVLIQQMKVDGLLVGYKEGEGDRRPESRYELAVTTHAITANIRSSVDDLTKDSELVSVSNADAILRRPAILRSSSEFKKYTAYKGDLLKLVDEFYFELATLGANPEEMVAMIKDSARRLASFKLAEPGERFMPFTDVQKSHWASSAINELKDAGILIGDGQGKFGG